MHVFVCICICVSACVSVCVCCVRADVQIKAHTVVGVHVLARGQCQVLFPHTVLVREKTAQSTHSSLTPYD